MTSAEHVDDFVDERIREHPALAIASSSPTMRDILSLDDLYDGIHPPREAQARAKQASLSPRAYSRNRRRRERQQLGTQETGA